MSARSFHVGQRFTTRGGAVVRIAKIIDAGPKLNERWKPTGESWRILFCEIERRADGVATDPEHPLTIALGDGGNYFPMVDGFPMQESELDLMAEVAELGCFAA